MKDILLKILNQDQVKFYLANGVQPKSIELGKKDKIVFFFSKAETHDLFTKWLEISAKQRELKKEKRI